MSKRVIAIQDANDKIVRSYGEGELIGHLTPDASPFNEIEGFKNPCIRLDSGKYIWGFECWWGTVEKMEKMIGGRAVEIVQPPNTLPVGGIQ